jgi:hypothetical protein
VLDWSYKGVAGKDSASLADCGAARVKLGGAQLQ